MPPAPVDDSETSEDASYPQTCHWYMATGKVHQRSYTAADYDAYMTGEVSIVGDDAAVAEPMASPGDAEIPMTDAIAADGSS